LCSSLLLRCAASMDSSNLPTKAVKKVAKTAAVGEPTSSAGASISTQPPSSAAAAPKAQTKKVGKVAKVEEVMMPKAVGVAIPLLNMGLASSSSSAAADLPVVPMSARDALLAARPKKAARKAKAASTATVKQTQSQREWSKKPALPFATFLWSLTISQLKNLMQLLNVPDNTSSDRASAVTAIYDHIQALEKVDEEEEEEEAVESDTEEESSEEPPEEPEEPLTTGLASRCATMVQQGEDGQGDSSSNGTDGTDIEVETDDAAPTPSPTPAPTAEASDAIDNVKAKLSYKELDRLGHLTL
jgi:hypothetical protein